MKKLLLSAMLMGSAFAANAQEITFAMEPSYPPFETTNEKAKSLVLMWMLRMQFVRKSKQLVTSKAKLLMP